MRSASISSYTTTFNCLEMRYPLKECIEGLLGFSDEVVIVDAGSTDGTIEQLQEWSRREKRIKFFVEPVDFSHPRWAIHMDGLLKRASRKKCTAEYCWQTDTDEIVVPHDYERIRQLPFVFEEVFKNYPIVFLPMIEFWGSLDRIRADFLSWKPRFSPNLPNITHGIPLEFRMVDMEGNSYPRPFESDSCNYIWQDSETSVPQCFPMKIERIDMPPGEFDAFIHKSIESFPSVLHISWLNLRRKLLHYRTHWAKFHASMYNIDDPTRNDWFPKPWSEVTDEDIRQKAEELLRCGPRFHHKKEHGPTVQFRGVIPQSLRTWAEADFAKK